MSVGDYAQNAAVQGTFEGVKTELRGGEFKEGFQTGAVLSAVTGTALQMRAYVIDNFDYAGKDGS